MSVYIASINSGSNGNCYYIGNGSDAILVDAGISCRETEKRMIRLNLSLRNVRALFISHEHTDHIKGLEVLSRKYSIPVYITEKTLQGSRARIERHLLQTFNEQAPVSICGFTITSFTKYHDAAEPHSFVVTHKGINIGVFTDIGRICEKLVYHFKTCHAAFLEANYDTQMLDGGRYPIFLKNRIRGGHGHLSNEEALRLFIEHRPAHLSHLLLSHLSKDNNDPQLVQELFNKHSNGVYTTVASRYAESAVYYITNTDTAQNSKVYRTAEQAVLF